MLNTSYIHIYLKYLMVIMQEYSTDDNSEPDVDLENQYYNSKALKEEDPNAALQSFEKVRNFSYIFF